MNLKKRNSPISQKELDAAQALFLKTHGDLERKAQNYLALDDIHLANIQANIDGETQGEEALEQAYEERFHCEICIVRDVLEIMWPAVQNYLNILETALGTTDPFESTVIEPDLKTTQSDSLL